MFTLSAGDDPTSATLLTAPQKLGRLRIDPITLRLRRQRVARCGHLEAVRISQGRM